MIIYIFYGSLLGMVGMLSVKMYEVKQRRRSLVYHLFVQFDEFTHGMLAKVLGSIRFRKEKLEVFLKNDLKAITYQTIVQAIAHSREAYDNMRKSARGVQKLKENPKVSAFLRDIEVAKKEIGEKQGEIIE